MRRGGGGDDLVVLASKLVADLVAEAGALLVDPTMSVNAMVQVPSRNATPGEYARQH